MVVPLGSWVLFNGATQWNLLSLNVARVDVDQEF
jgi:hypothetical protein